MPKPNFLYIGADKAGSTWLFKVFQWHPDIYMAPGKDIYFFDRYFDRGMPWYEKQFSEAEHERVLCEISHDYLYAPEVALRIYDSLPDVKLMVCLREPVDRAFSAYLYLLKHGYYEGTFEQALQDKERLIDHGRYGTYLEPFLELFGKERIHVGVFDTLKADPNQFALRIFEFLGVDVSDIPDELRGKTQAAARARAPKINAFVKRSAVLARDLGLAKLVGNLKSSKVIGKLLYQPYDEGEKPSPSEDTLQSLRKVFAPEIEKLDKLCGTDFGSLWQYNTQPESVNTSKG